MKKRKFVKGQKVYSIDNSVWGMSPMTIIGFYDECGPREAIRCKHPSLGIGCFEPVGLRPFTERRKKSLERLQDEELRFERMEDRLFRRKK